MKIKLFAVILLMAASFTACNSQKMQTGKPTLVGKWQMTETLADIGDGKATWTPVSKDSVQYVVFTKDGRVSGNAFYNTTAYKLIDSNHVEFSITGNTSLITHRYQVTATTLLLNPPCREACGMRFIRMK
jgi:hypothetical protein